MMSRTFGARGECQTEAEENPLRGHNTHAHEGEQQRVDDVLARHEPAVEVREAGRHAGMFQKSTRTAVYSVCVWVSKVCLSESSLRAIGIV